MGELERATRSIELESKIEAPVEAVWRALSEAEELVRWFPLDARVEPGAGGSIWLSWGPGVEGQAPIDVWEPGRRLRWVEEAPPKPSDEDGAGPVRLAVDFHLEGQSGSTVLRLVHSGFGTGADWDDHYHGMEGGWTYFLLNLRHYLERHPGVPRTLIWVRRPVTSSTAEFWDRILGPGGLGVEVGSRPAGPVVGERYRLTLGDAGVLSGTVAFVRAPVHFAGTVEELEDSLLFVELEGGPHPPPHWHCGVWLSTYGLARPRTDRLQRALERTLAALSWAGSGPGP